MILVKTTDARLLAVSIWLSIDAAMMWAASQPVPVYSAFHYGLSFFFALADGVREVSKVKNNMGYAYSHIDILKCNTPTCISIYPDRV